MHAALLYGKEDLRVQQVTTPQIGEGEILLEMKSAAICGTDVRMYRNGHPGISSESPLILGHELSGVIAETSSGVNNYRVGMPAALAPNMGCGICNSCVSGNTQLCKQYIAFGINIDGGFAEYVRIPKEAVRQGNLFEIPPGVSFEAAALAEPLSCVFNGFLRSEIRPGDSVLIIGAGPIGLMHAKLAKMAGAGQVILSDLSEPRLDVCRKIDRSFLTVSGDSIADQIMELSAGHGVDVCITACPSAGAQATALEVAAVNGRVFFFGGLPAGRSRVVLDTNLIHYKQLVVSGTTRSNLIQFRKALELISQGLIWVNDLITHRHPIEGIAEAFGQVMQAEGLKHLVIFQ